MSMAPETFPRGSFNDDLLAIVVERLVRGESWDEAAQAIQWDVNELKRVCRNEPLYNAAYEYAKRERDREDEARVRRKLREGLDNADPKKAQKAAEFFAKELAAERRDQTRLDVERMRAESRQMSAQARMMCAQVKQSKPEKEEGLIEDTPEQARQRKENWYASQGQQAELLCRDKHPVYLWKGCHKLDGVLPDETDVPVALIADSTVQGRTIYWAIPLPLPTHLQEGPFFAPPGLAI